MDLHSCLLKLFFSFYDGSNFGMLLEIKMNCYCYDIFIMIIVVNFDYDYFKYLIKLVT